LEHCQVPDRKNIVNIHHPYPETEWMMKCPDYDPGSLSAITDEGVTFRITKIKSHILESFLDNKAFQAGIIFKSV
jgi:hypothetical protein